GSEIAVRARAFGMTVVAFDPYVNAERFERLQVPRRTALDELLSTVDVLTVHTPLTPETKGMITARELAMLPAGAIVANLARGGIIVEDDLLAALEGNRLRGAMLDVYSKEPLAPDHPFRRLPNVVLTPHLGASTAEGQRNVAVDVCAHVRDALVSGEL